MSGSGANTAIALRIENLNVPILADSNCYRVHGQFGGRNGYNRPRVKTSPSQWDPDFDQDSKPVPPNGAIVCSSGERFVYVTVTPATFATMVAPTSADAMVAGDAALEGRTDVAEGLAQAALASTLAALSDDECSVLYAHGCLKSFARKRLVDGRASALESLVSRGMIKRSSNGATQITTLGKAQRVVWDHHRFDREFGSTRSW